MHLFCKWEIIAVKNFDTAPAIPAQCVTPQILQMAADQLREGYGVKKTAILRRCTVPGCTQVASEVILGNWTLDEIAGKQYYTHDEVRAKAK